MGSNLRIVLFCSLYHMHHWYGIISNTILRNITLKTQIFQFPGKASFSNNFTWHMDSAVFGTAVFGVVTGVRAGQTGNRGAINGSGKIFVSSWDPTVWVKGTLSLLFKGYRGHFLQDQNSQCVTTHLHPVPRVRMLSVLPLFPHTSSRRVHGQLYFQKQTVSFSEQWHV